MNMLVAIITQSYENMRGKEDESSLPEIVQMMEDFVWLDKLEEHFSNKKFIMIVSVCNEQNESNENGYRTIEFI